ncbi:N-6 DNA methylase [Runella zeae]|uniref:N-6 DNA methylase n=1 Tax=Runella zeae TaxID=94255 RepID=UPI002355D4D8|nr:N-6 DNA methylase [Runella zeae]
MPKTTDVPQELREFNKIFEQIAYRHGYSEVFYDFVDYCIACFLDTGDAELAKRLQKRYEKEYSLFSELFREWILTQHKMIVEEHEWYDAFGAFYEVLSSHSKSSALGQFFTPPHLVDILTHITYQDKKHTRKRISDPCSGSGRMLISFHAHFPGNYTFGADIDPICTKMTALNMMIHGCEGQSVCMDTLNPEDWRFGFAINPYIHHTRGMPHLVRIQKEQCLQWQSFQQDKKAFAKKEMEDKQAQIIVDMTVKIEPTIGKHGQLSFF